MSSIDANDPNNFSARSSSTHLEGDATLQGIGSIGQNTGTINIYNRSARRKTHTQPPLAHNLSLKYLADRDEQERLIRLHLVGLRTSRRPTLFFVHGEASQLLDGFVDRLGKETIPRLLRITNSTDQVECKPVPWPYRGAESDKEAAYKNSLTDMLGVLHGTPEEVVEYVALCRRPVLLTSVHREVVDNDEEPGIRAILDFWASSPDLRTELSLIVVVAMSYVEAKPGFLARFLAQPKPSGLAQTLAKFNGYLPNKLNVFVLPQLGDISLDEAEHWVRNWLRPTDIEDALRRVREAFGATGAPLPMARLEKHLDALVPQGRARLRLQ